MRVLVSDWIRYYKTPSPEVARQAGIIFCAIDFGAAHRGFDLREDVNMKEKDLLSILLISVL